VYRLRILVGVSIQLGVGHGGGNADSDGQSAKVPAGVVVAMIRQYVAEQIV